MLIRLSALVGKVNLSDTMSPNTIVQTQTTAPTPTVSVSFVEPAADGNSKKATGEDCFNAVFCVGVKPVLCVR